MAFSCRFSDCIRQFFPLKNIFLCTRLLFFIMCLLILVVDSQYANKMQTLNKDVNRVNERNSSGNNSTILNIKGVKKITFIEKLIKANNLTTDMFSNKEFLDGKISSSAGSLLPKGDIAHQRLILLPRQRNIHSIQISTPRTQFQTIGKIPSNKMINAEQRSFNSVGKSFGLSENVVLSSKDAEREAQLLYEKSLKEFHDSIKAEEEDIENTTALSDILNPGIIGVLNPERSLRSVCEVWRQKHCQCIGILGRLSITCRNIGILAVPVNLPPDTVILDLTNNNITELKANSFFMVNNLEELILAENSLISIDIFAFYDLNKLKRLNLQNCGLKTLPENGFQGLNNLLSLQLNGNSLANLDANSLKYLPKLRSVRLEANLFYRIPTNALRTLKTLEILNLGSNLLTIINDDDFPQMPKLLVLLLKRNQIMKIADNGFKNLTALRVLELEDNLINTFPANLHIMSHLQELSAGKNRIRWLKDNDLPQHLEILDLRANPISQTTVNSLNDMSKIRKLILSDVRYLKIFPNLDGCQALELIKLDRAGISKVPLNLCHHSPRLKSLELKTNFLEHPPSLFYCRELRLLDISSNFIENINGRPFLGLVQLNDLLLSYNRIRSIPHDAFHGLSKLQLLDLEGNQITFIHSNAFTVFTSLEDLNLGNNMFPELPSNGLSRLLHLKTFNNPKLRSFPSPDIFPRIQTLVLSYAYHCCSFIPLVAMAATRKPPLVQETVLFPTDTDFDMSLWNNSMLDIWPQLHNLSRKFGLVSHNMWSELDTDFTFTNGGTPSIFKEYLEEEVSLNGKQFDFDTSHSGSNSKEFFKNINSRNLFSDVDNLHVFGGIQCLPMPGPFLPCADLFDWWTLRCGVWVVFLLSLLGNGTVVFVLVFSRSKMDVPRFLVCNLAAADFFMGIYLGILAIVDASTLGEFRMFAIPWQMSVLCQFAGFLAVLSSELSVYTLAVITLERNYAITHAIHLNKRLSLKQAGYIMIVGWIFALIMAILPLVGISDYRKFAVCLPFETTTGIASLTYVITLMIINGCAFLTLMACYLKMYWAIRGSQAWNTNDSRIAKRMALLVFTDFLCWSPIAFFSITAIFGLQLISLEQAKIFTVFILPLNSCCNPFLYAIMTNQFKKDCVLLCKRFEERRVNKSTQQPGLNRRAADTGIKELPPLLPNTHHPPGCKCLRMLPNEMPYWHRIPDKKASIWSRVWKKFVKSCSICLCCECCVKERNRRSRQELRKNRNERRHKSNPYQYQFANVKQKKTNRTSSMSSDNYCSSRSSSWRNGTASTSQLMTNNHQHTCNFPLRMMDYNRRRHSSWLITRKTSHDSNLSSSRNDSSASGTTASTSTFRLSRSSAGSSTPLPSLMLAHNSKTQFMHQYSATMPKPRLVRQEAVQEEEDALTPRLGVRFLPTIPSAADSSIAMEEGDSNLCAMFISALSTDSPNNCPVVEIKTTSVQENYVRKSSMEVIQQSSCSLPSPQDQPP